MVTRKKRSKLSVQLRQFSTEGSEYSQTILKLSIVTSMMAGYMNKMFVYLFAKQKKVWNGILG